MDGNDFKNVAPKNGNSLAAGDWRELLIESAAFVHTSEKSKSKALRMMAESLFVDCLRGVRDRIIEALVEREGLLSTGIGLGIAMPHTRISAVGEHFIESRFGWFSFSPPIEWDSVDAQPVRLAICINCPQDCKKLYLESLAKINRLIGSQGRGRPFDKQVFESVIGAASADKLRQVVTTRFDELWSPQDQGDPE